MIQRTLEEIIRSQPFNLYFLYPIERPVSPFTFRATEASDVLVFSITKAVLRSTRTVTDCLGCTN